MPEIKQTITSKIDPAVIERLDTLAERIGWTRSELIAHCVEFGLREGEKFAERLSSPMVGHLMRLAFHVDTSDPQQRAEFDAMHKAVRDQGKRSGKLGTA